jgi:hypothetical protein
MRGKKSVVTSRGEAIDRSKREHRYRKVTLMLGKQGAKHIEYYLFAGKHKLETRF